MKKKVLSFLSLFTSFSTLICCALPALFVTIGLGATVASLISSFPWLITLSSHKEWLFLGAGALIALSFFLAYRPRKQLACDVETKGGEGCETAGRFNKAVLWTSAGLYFVGLFMAYLALPLFMFIEIL